MDDKDSEKDNADDEAHELDHSKLSDNQEDTEEGKQSKRDSDSEEGIIEVVFDSGGMKVAKRYNFAIDLTPGLQLVLKDEELEEEEDEVDNIDAEVEENSIVTAEEGDGK